MKHTYFITWFNTADKKKKSDFCTIEADNPIDAIIEARKLHGFKHEQVNNIARIDEH